MGVVHESFLAWRIKFLIPAVVILLMLISVLRRHILPLFFSLLVVFSFAAPSYSATWNDVVTAWGAHTPGPGCIDFVTSYQSNGQTGYRLWSRCNGAAIKAFTINYSNGSVSADTNGAPVNNCVGLDSNVSYPATAIKRSSNFRRDTFCDAHVSADYSQVNSSTGFQVISGLCKWHTWQGSSCVALDVLVQDFFPVVESCSYTNITLYDMSGGYAGTVYKSYAVDDRNVNVCNQCIPSGTVPAGYASHNTVDEFDPSKRYQCYWKDVTGDPVAASDSFVPPVSGGGDIGDSGGGRYSEISLSESIDINSVTVDGSTETTQTTTSQTVQSDGLTTTTKTTEITNCVDQNSDGLSDISGRNCTEVVTDTETGGSDSGLGVSKPGAYSNGALPEVGNFGSLFSDFAADIRGTQLFSTFSLSGLVPSGSGSSSYTLDFGNYGTHNFDLANYSTALNIIKGFMLLLASYLAVRVVVLKR